MKAGQLVVIHSIVDCQDQVFLLQQKQRLLGRSSVCNFQIEDPLISSLHAYFFYENEQFFVVDLLAANGVFHNDILIDLAPLRPKDKIRVGKTVLEFSEYQGDQEGKTYITGEAPTISKRRGKVKAAPEESVKMTLGRMIKKTQDLNICRLALKNRKITHAQIRSLIEQQQALAEHGKECDLVSLVLEANLLTQEDIQKIVRENEYYKVRNKDISLSRLIMRQRMLPEEKVQECLKAQEQYFQNTQTIPRLGEILVQKGYLTVHQNNEIIRALQRRKKK